MLQYVFHLYKSPLACSREIKRSHQLDGTLNLTALGKRLIWKLHVVYHSYTGENLPFQLLAHK